MLNWRDNLSQSSTIPSLETRIGSREFNLHREPPVQHDVFQSLVNLLYPQYCCQCGRIGKYLCPTCFEFIHFYSQPLNLRLEASYLDTVIAMGRYAEPLSSLIHTLKYQSVKGVAAWCAELLYLHTQIPNCEVIVPVPISKQRWRERGFNQAEEIGKHLASFLAVPCVNILIRNKHSAPQASVTDQANRKKRLENFFTINLKAFEAIPTTVLLIDDVITTGATLNECAKALKLNGIKNVYALGLAHGQ